MEECAGALSCKKLHSPDLYCSSLTLRMCLSMHPLTVYTEGTNSLWIMPQLSNKTISIVFTFDLATRAFTGLASLGSKHWAVWSFVDGSYWKHYVSSPLTIFLKNSNRSQPFQPNHETQWDVISAHLWVCAARTAHTIFSYPKYNEQFLALIPNWCSLSQQSIENIIEFIQSL